MHDYPNSRHQDLDRYYDWSRGVPAEARPF